MADLFFKLRRARIDSISVDASVRETHNRTAEMTEHQIEQGGKINDHLALGSDTLDMDLLFTDSPLEAREDGTVSDDDGTVTGGQVSATPGHAIAMCDRLRQLMADKVLMTVVTGRRTYDNMALIKVGEPVDARTGGGARVAVSFKQARFVTTKVTTTKLAKDPRGKGRVKTGTAATRILDSIPGGNAAKQFFYEQRYFSALPGGNALSREKVEHDKRVAALKK